MSDDGFEKVQQQMESTLAELKVATDPIQRRMLLGRMSWLLGKAEEISNQPPTVRKMDNGAG
jgi:hypothetical protein